MAASGRKQPLTRLYTERLEMTQPLAWMYTQRLVMTQSGHSCTAEEQIFAWCFGYAS